MVKVVSAGGRDECEIFQVGYPVLATYSSRFWLLQRSAQRTMDRLRCKIGRTVQKDRGTVTGAKGGQSNHNFGIAWDVGIFDRKKYYEGNNKKEEQAYH
jgi:hypothetical protein